MTRPCVQICATALTTLALMTQAIAPVSAQISSGARKSVEETRAQETAELPRCAKPLGTLSVGEPETRWWTDMGLGSPEALIRVYVQKSGCFKLVSRSARAMQAMSRERELMGSGELKRGGTVGKGQITEADFTVIPDIVSQNANKGGNAIGGLLGGMIGGVAGAVIGGINIKKKSANVTLGLVSNKSLEEQVYEGQSKKSDLGWGAGGGAFFGGFAAGGASGYADTEIGQVVALAYLDAYKRMVTDMGGLSDFTSAQQTERAVTMKRAGRLYSGKSIQSGSIAELEAGQMLYPTGEKTEQMWQVENELGQKGWVPVAQISVAK